MPLSRTALMAETGRSKAEVEAAASRLINDGYRDMFDRIDAVRDGDGNFSTLEVHFSDHGAAALREALKRRAE